MPWGYNKEELILQLQDLADRLGRAPKTKDIQNDVYTATHATFKKHFGSIQKARKAAGLKENVHPGNRKKYDKKELIRKLKQFARKLGRTPKMAEIDDNDELPSSLTYQYQFGKYRKACEMAGLKPNHGKNSGGFVNTI